MHDKKWFDTDQQLNPTELQQNYGESMIPPIQTCFDEAQLIWLNPSTHV